jgi:hypothetical protein
MRSALASGNRAGRPRLPRAQAEAAILMLQEEVGIKAAGGQAQIEAQQ